MDNSFPSVNGAQPVPNGQPSVAQMAPQEPTSQSPSFQDQIPVDQPAGNNPFYLTFGFWAFMFFLVNLVVVFFLWIYPLLSPPLVVEDQPISATFNIKKLRITSQGFLVLSAEQTGENNDIYFGPVAKSPLLIPDTYEDFVIPIESGQTLEEFSVRLKPNTIVKVAFYYDSDENGNFDFDTDITVHQDVFGRKLQGTFILR